MKKFARLAVILSLLVGMLGIGAAPASASHEVEVCVVVTGEAELSAGLSVPPAPPVSASVSVNVAVGGCVGANAVIDNPGVSGNVTGHSVHFEAGADVAHQTGGNGAGGWCGHSLGSVTVVLDGVPHTGTWVSAGTQLVLTGQVTGSVNAVVDSTHPHSAPPVGSGPGNSCTNGTAHHFLVNGSVVIS